MVKVSTYFGMSLAAFVFWQSMDKLHVWIALHQDEKQERLEREAEVRRVREELLKENKYKDALIVSMSLKCKLGLVVTVQSVMYLPLSLLK
ncbi:hypothetical protein AB3S75_038386 [Citrus x aurantiifolia]